MTFDERLEQLRAAFRARLEGERRALRDAALRDDAATLRTIAHRLAGAGAVFGYPAISRAASAVDEAEPGAELASLVDGLLAAIDDAVADIPPGV